VTFTPSTRLSAGLRYTVTVSGALSLGGTAQAPSTWSFTTNDVAVCPCTAFESDATPGVRRCPATGTPISLGMQFSPSADGYITGVAVLQERREQRDAHRQPVVVGRSAARHGDVHR
jgi:hypothetical protein